MLVAWSLAAAVSAVSQPRSQDDFFRLTFDHKFFAYVVFDSKNSQYAKKLVDRLMADLSVADVIKEKAVHLGQADVADIPMLREHYDIPGNFALFFFINNRLQRFGEFTELAQDFLDSKLLFADLLEETAKFLRGRIGRLNAPLRSFEEFQSAVRTHKIIGVFLGETEGFFFDQFSDFAAKHVDFDFFHAASPYLADQIHSAATDHPRPAGQDLFAIVRDPSLLNDIDNKALVSIDAQRLLEDYTAFFEYERFPKLRDASHGNDIFFRLYNANQKLVVYVYNDQTALDDLNQFKKAVYLLPRIFIFAHANSNEAGFGSIMQMFIQAGQNPTENRVYVFHSIGAKLFAEVVPAAMNAEKIVEGVGRYFQHHRALFTRGERAIVGDSEDGGDKEPAEESAPEPELVYQEL